MIAFFLSYVYNSIRFLFSFQEVLFMRTHYLLRHYSLYSALLIALLGILAAGCAKPKETKKPQDRKIPVSATEAISKTVPVQIRAVGSVSAFSTVAVRSRVEGEIVNVHFTEGETVHKGNLLFSIDAKSFETRVKQAEAALSRSMAQLENARRQKERFAQLSEKGYIARQEYEQIRTNFSVLEETVRADSASLEESKIQLEYTKIRAPLSGRTGNLLAHKGSIVKPGADTPLVIIHQIHPVYVSFSLPEKELPRLKEGMRTRRIPTEAFIPGDNDLPSSKGFLSFMDNEVDKTTGTIGLKARFENSDNALWPGQFVELIVTLSLQPNAIVVPAQAVQISNEGPYVFVIREDHTIEKRLIETDSISDTENIISKGLQAGEQVVTDGHLLLIPGVKVEVKK
jgi:multidrug efflux system membrane fusion protein